MPISIVPTSKEHWLQLRSEDVTSTEVAALFDLSPYMTRLELHYLKAGKATVDFEATDRMKWGIRFEEATARGVAEDFSLKIRKISRYMRHSDHERVGSSFDYEIVGIIADGIEPINEFQAAYEKHGAGILEIKCVDGLVYKNSWQPTEAPEHIETQVQYQLEVSNREWAIICPLVGGNDAKPFIRMRDRDVGKALMAAVAEFWANVDAGIEPEPDFSRDSEFLIKLHQQAGDAVMTTEDDRVAALFNRYRKAAAEAKAADDEKEAVKAEILTVVGDDHSKVICGNMTLSCGMTKDTPPTVITPEMVGTTYGGRKGYRMFKLNERVAK